jgi:purine-binding chemotaxis protein CheW
MSTADENHFVFLHRDLQYALPIGQVVEIVETPALLPFHGDLSGCLGNVAHRDHLLPVLDPTALATPRGAAAAPAKTFIVVRHDGAVFGLAMDRFVAVVGLDALGAAPTEPAGAGHPFVETVRAFRNNALISLSASAIAARVRSNFGSQQQLGAGRGPLVARGEGEQRIFLCARIANVVFAIPVEHVLEVVEGHDVTPLFKMPPLVRGLINLRGQVLACVDLSADLGLPPRPLEERNQFVVLKGEGAELALCVDKVPGIRRLQPQRIQKADLALTGDLTRYAEGVLEEEDGALFVLAVQAVFEAPQLQPYRRQEA